jgi:uncharacterized protein YyaL (SSP411 family)
MVSKKILWGVSTLLLIAAPSAYANELLRSSSAYLLQHADNPIDWRIWSQKSLEDAKKENKIIFISIGYSSCHWCHTMNHESFKDKEIASHLNEHFVSIKIDREENPDVDRHFMKQVTALKGSGGWPLNLFLLPTGEIITGGSYYTKEAFQNLISQLSKLWHNAPQRLMSNAKMTASLLHQLDKENDTPTPQSSYNTSEMITHLVKLEDEAYGGFGKNEKFPNVSILLYLLERYQKQKDEKIWRIVENALDAMAYGAINDQVSGGFHRYTSDRKWEIPHFEKMLYDQALLIKVYATAYQLSGKQHYKTIAKETITFVFNVLQSDNGLFCASLDAQSNGKEGSYYLWHTNMLENIEDSSTVKALFNISESEPKALTYKRDANLTTQTRTDIRERLRNLQKMLPQPHRDEKIILSWNAMMVDALNVASDIFKDSALKDQTIKTAKQLLRESRDDQGRLKRILSNHTLRVGATLESYVYISDMLLGLYDTCRDLFWLNHAEIFVKEMLKVFYDEKAGGLYDNTSSTLLGKRTKNFEDNEIPSVQGMAAIVLMKLGQRTGNRHYTEEAAALLNTFQITQKVHLQKYATLFRAYHMHDNFMNNNEVSSKNGAIHIAAKKNLNEVTIYFQIEKGTYINAEINNSKPIALQIEPPAAVERIVYPKAIKKYVTYQPEPVFIFKDNFNIKVMLKKNMVSLSLDITLQLTPCSSSYCGNQETLRLNLSK